MAHSQAGHRVATSASTIEDDPEIAYELRITGSPNVSTTNIQQSIDSPKIHFTGLKKQGNRCVEYHGREDFVVNFHNSSNNKWASCSCSNSTPCTHIYWAMNQYTNAKCRQWGLRRARGVIYPLGRDGSGQRVAFELEREDVWPVPIPAINTSEHASYVNGYIHQRLVDKTRKDMEKTLFSYNSHTETFTDDRNRRIERPIYAATQRSLEPIIAQACIRDRQFEEECKAILTPVRQAAIKLEDLRWAAAQNFTALSETWLGMRTDHHERVAKRYLDIYAYEIHVVYNVYLVNVASKGWDDNTLEATNAAASALIFMLQGAVDRTSLWQELTLTDYDYDEPSDFWTNVFFAFNLMLAQDGLERQHRSELQAIRERAKELATIRHPTSNILNELKRITRLS
ncbi:hypothetical protein Vi05172_g10021 [Venturia inaequalis]|nr:hypothetical protein Vi05172_g10021 [Venturia inaequalis]